MIAMKILSSDAFQKWFNDLKDFKVVKAIKARIDRMKVGSFGVNGVKNIFESRVHVRQSKQKYKRSRTHIK
jgi:putative component of toxin-antitoxin plasmid stabilization module